MPRGKVVKPEVEGLIILVHLGNRKMPSREVRNIVESRLRADENYRALWPIPERWPGLSTVQHVLADFHKREANDPDKEQEEPWDVSTLGKHPIPWEAVPFVLDLSMSLKKPLTIREAKWIGRLYGLLSTIASQQGLDSADWTGDIAAFYATTERINTLMGERVAPAMDKILWEFLTKQESVDEVAKRGFDPGDDDDRFRKGIDGRLYYGGTKKELNRLKKMQHSLDPSKPFDGFAALGLTLEVKENKDERTNVQRQGAKAKRHR